MDCERHQLKGGWSAGNEGWGPIWSNPQARERTSSIGMLLRCWWNEQNWEWMSERSQWAGEGIKLSDRHCCKMCTSLWALSSAFSILEAEKSKIKVPASRMAFQLFVYMAQGGRVREGDGFLRMELSWHVHFLLVPSLQYCPGDWVFNTQILKDEFRNKNNLFDRWVPVALVREYRRDRRNKRKI